MRRLYFKIFLWFWLGIVVISLTLASVATLTYSREEDDRLWQEKYGPRVDLWARQEVDVLDQQGLQELSRYLGSFEYDPGVVNYIFDADGRELMNRQASPAVKSVLAAAGRKAGQRVDTKERIIADTVPDAHGRLYTVVVDQPAPTMLNRSLFEFLFAAPAGARLETKTIFPIIAVFGVAAAFCLWLAWQIVEPITRLRFTTRAIAHDLLQTRVDPKVLERRDELGDLGQDFDKMAARVERLVIAERRLLADVSHSLRSPLTRLNIALGLARKQTGPETAPHLDRIERETESLNRRVGQLLTMARIDSGVDVGRHAAPVDLKLLVQEIVGDAAYQAHDTQCTVTFQTDEPWCAANGSRELLHGAIENVVGNALQHTPRGTAVSVSLRVDRTASPARAVIAVRDHGTGVAPDVIERLFVPFNQVPDGEPGVVQGTGLGLAITKRTFDLFGGSVSAENAPDGGLVVTMKLPLA